MIGCLQSYRLQLPYLYMHLFIYSLHFFIAFSSADMATSNESQDPRQVHFLTIPWYSLGSQLDGRAKDNRYMNDNAVRARAGLLNMTAWTVTLLLFTVDKPKFILYSVGPIVLWDMVTASIFGLTPLSPYGILGTILTMKMKPVWKPAEPKR